MLLGDQPGCPALPRPRPPSIATTSSTCSTPRAPPAFPRASCSPTTTSSTTAGASATASASPPPTSCACRCPLPLLRRHPGRRMAILSHGATLVAVEVFDPLLGLAAIHQEKCTVLYGVPTMFIAMYSHPMFRMFDMSSLRTGIMARQRLPHGGHETRHRRHACHGNHLRVRPDRGLSGITRPMAPIRRTARLDRRPRLSRRGGRHPRPGHAPACRPAPKAKSAAAATTS